MQSKLLLQSAERIAVQEQVLVLALLGDIALQDGKPKLHAHVVLGRRDASALGGHLRSARVRPHSSKSARSAKARPLLRLPGQFTDRYPGKEILE